MQAPSLRKYMLSSIASSRHRHEIKGLKVDHISRGDRHSGGLDSEDQGYSSPHRRGCWKQAARVTLEQGPPQHSETKWCGRGCGQHRTPHCRYASPPWILVLISKWISSRGWTRRCILRINIIHKKSCALQESSCRGRIGVFGQSLWTTSKLKWWRGCRESGSQWLC